MLTACLDEFPAPPSETQSTRDSGVMSDSTLIDPDSEIQDALATVIDATTPDAQATADATAPLFDATTQDAQSIADAAAPMLDAATPDANELDAQLVDSAAPDAAMADAAAPDFGNVIIPDATADATPDAAEQDAAIPDAEIPSNIRIVATHLDSPTGQIDCYPGGLMGPPVRVRAGDLLTTAESGEDVYVVCLLAQAGVRITLEAQIDGPNCAGEIINGPLCALNQPIPDGCLTVNGIVTDGPNLNTIQMDSNAAYQVNYGPNSPDGHLVMVTARCN
ncbi:hypothetical protein KA119_01770 [Candidatus Gracilibacteria bacterium]|nr:hypothetical protein [Candidatus Gracilibacteria bacterium]